MKFYNQKIFLKKLIEKYNKKNFAGQSYPLLENAFTTEDILKGI